MGHVDEAQRRLVRWGAVSERFNSNPAGSTERVDRSIFFAPRFSKCAFPVCSIHAVSSRKYLFFSGWREFEFHMERRLSGLFISAELKKNNNNFSIENKRLLLFFHFLNLIISTFLFFSKPFLLCGMGLLNAPVASTPKRMEFFCSLSI